MCEKRHFRYRKSQKFIDGHPTVRFERRQFHFQGNYLSRKMIWYHYFDFIFFFFWWDAKKMFFASFGLYGLAIYDQNWNASKKMNFRSVHVVLELKWIITGLLAIISGLFVCSLFMTSLNMINVQICMLYAWFVSMYICILDLNVITLMAHH